MADTICKRRNDPMKKAYGISFLVVIIALIAVYQASYYFAQQNFEKQAKIDEKKKIEEELVQADTNKESVTTKDTQYVINVYNSENEIAEEKTIDIPENYIGCTREELVEVLEDVELVSFSSERIVVKQKVADETYEYYLAEENGYITVLLSDKTTVYTYTDIEVASLPEEIQNEIKTLKPIKDLNHLYSFLETYTS